MKLRPRTFAIQWDVHAWAGVVASVFLFQIFFCGIFALFRGELETWADPAALSSSEREADFDAITRRLEAGGHVPFGARVFLRREGMARAVFVTVIDPHEAEPTTFWAEPDGSSLAVPRSGLAEELYRLHFFERLPGGLEASGVLAVGLLVAVVTGVVIHLKDLRRQLWQFRPALRLRFAASDGHKVLGVFGTPFAALFGWSGAVLCLFGLTQQGVQHVAFRGDARAVERARAEGPAFPEPSGRPGARLPLNTLVAAGRQALPRAARDVRFVDLPAYGDADAHVGIFFEPTRDFEEPPSVIMRARDGGVLAVDARAKRPLAGFERTLFDLHFARFGGLLTKVLYALLALGVCAVIVTGNVVFLERRPKAREGRAYRLLARLTIGPTLGLVVGSAAAVVGTRLLPASLSRRSDVEIGVLLCAWLFATVAAFGMRASDRVTAKRLAFLAGALYVLAAAAGVIARGGKLGTDELIAEAVLIGLGAASFLVAALLRPASVRAPP